MASDSIPQVREIITRSQAQALGLRRYFTGKPCKNGHLAERFTRNKQCLDCGREHNRRWEKQNLEKRRKIDRRRREKNPEKRRDSCRLSQKKYPERQRERQRLWRQNNPAKAREAMRLWREQQPGMLLAQRHKRRARKQNAGGTFTATDIKDIRKLQRNRCARCSASLRCKTVHVDHITPLALGGTNGRKNIQLLCKPCNLSKNASDPIDDMRRLGRLL